MAETRTVAVVFTDLVDSTRLSTSVAPEVADTLREEHFALLRAAVNEHSGTEVKNLGDGVMVIFPISSGALNCAEAMQQALERVNRGAIEPLAMRIGISHGEVTERDGDFFGDAVVEAARLCAVAQGGQILATQLVQLAAGRRAAQEFVSVGPLDLKGLPEPVPAVDVRWEPTAGHDDGRVPLPKRCEVVPAAGFVGRATECGVLADALKAVATGRQQIVLIGGEPGMGKTTLATECAREAYENGATVLFGRADEDLTVPYGPWVEALTHLVAQAPEPMLKSLTPQMGELAPLDPVFGARTSNTPTTADPEAARYLLFNAVAGVLRAAAELSPLVIVLDDLHWADAQTLQLLRHVASANEPMRVMIIGTFRESDITASHPLSDLLGALHREQGTGRISLRGLSDVELLDLMEAAAGEELQADGIALRDAVLAETDGNPFFAGELLRHLVETGSIYQDNGRWVASDELRHRGLPVSVREVIGRRVARLGDSGVRVLSTAAVIGRDFDLGLLSAAAELNEDDLLDVMDRAIEATLVENVLGTRYTFVHALIEHTLYDSMAPARRARIHRAVAEAIESQTRGRTEGRTAELAYHWAQATAPEDIDKAVGYARAAGDEALARLAPDEALRSYTQALTLIDSLASDRSRLRCGILIGMGNAQRQTGQAAFRETLLEAGRVAQELGDTDLLVEAALANNRGLQSSTGSVDAERIAVLESACAAVAHEESARQARLLAHLASELTFSGDMERLLALSEEAIALARQCDPATIAEVLYRFTVAVNVPENLPERLVLCAEALQAAQTSGDPVLQYWAAACNVLTLNTAGRVTEADDALALCVSLSERLRQPGLQWGLLNNQVGRAFIEGNLARAEQLMYEAYTVGTAANEPDVGAVFAAHFGMLRTLQGRSHELVDLLAKAAEENPGLPGFRTFLAHIYCDLDRPDHAREVLAPFVADEFASIPRDFVWRLAIAQSVYTVAHLRWIEPAELLLERLRHLPDQIIFFAGLVWGSNSHDLALLAATLGQKEDAEAYFAQAMEMHERCSMPFGVAVTQLAWGERLVEWGRVEDRERATSMLTDARRTAREGGLGLVERRATRALESLGSQ